MLDRIRAVTERLAYLAPTVDDPAHGGLIHGDLHLSNTWWDGSHVGGLIDLEWVRLGPPWMDLSRFQDNVDTDQVEGLEAHPQLREALREAYPELFAIDHLDDRIRYLQIAFNVRQSFVYPRSDPDQVLSADHPLVRLPVLVSAG